jgi:hypothetical protein
MVTWVLTRVMLFLTLVSAGNLARFCADLVEQRHRQPCDCTRRTAAPHPRPTSAGAHLVSGRTWSRRACASRASAPTAQRSRFRHSTTPPLAAGSGCVPRPGP